MITLKTILIPVDFSECSDGAVKYGYALAEAFGATVHLLHVVHDPYMMPWAAEGFAAPTGDLLTDWEAAARKRLLDLVSAGSTVQAQVATRVGPAQPEIVRYAASHGIDLIVLGTHGRGTLGHLLLGSVAERVVRTAACPVLTVRHPKHEMLTDSPVDLASESRQAGASF